MENPLPVFQVAADCMGEWEGVEDLTLHGGGKDSPLGLSPGP